MKHNRLEELCKQLRLSHLPQAVNNGNFETKEDWLLFYWKMSWPAVKF